MFTKVFIYQICFSIEGTFPGLNHDFLTRGTIANNSAVGSLKHLHRNSRYELKDSAQKVDRNYALNLSGNCYHLWEEILKANPILIIIYYLLRSLPYIIYFYSSLKDNIITIYYWRKKKSQKIQVPHLTWQSWLISPLTGILLLSGSFLLFSSEHPCHLLG